MMHAVNGDQRLDAELDAAVLASREDMGMSTRLKLGLAKSCLENNKEEAATEVILEVMRNTSNQADMKRAMGVFESAGKGHLGKELAQRSLQEVKDLVALGVQKAKSGDFRGSVSLMVDAARKSPDNPQVVLNAALAALKCLENLGWDQETANHAKRLIAAAANLDPMNPRLKAIRGLFEELQHKYGITTSFKVK